MLIPVGFGKETVSGTDIDGEVGLDGITDVSRRDEEAGRSAIPPPPPRPPTQETAKQWFLTPFPQ